MVKNDGMVVMQWQCIRIFCHFDVQKSLHKIDKTNLHYISKNVMYGLGKIYSHIQYTDLSEMTFYEKRQKWK